MIEARQSRFGIDSGRHPNLADRLYALIKRKRLQAPPSLPIQNNQEDELKRLQQKSQESWRELNSTIDAEKVNLREHIDILSQIGSAEINEHVKRVKKEQAEGFNRLYALYAPSFAVAPTELSSQDDTIHIKKPENDKTETNQLERMSLEESVMASLRAVGYRGPTESESRNSATVATILAFLAALAPLAAGIGGIYFGVRGDGELPRLGLNISDGNTKNDNGRAIPAPFATPHISPESIAALQSKHDQTSLQKPSEAVSQDKKSDSASSLVNKLGGKFNRWADKIKRKFN